MPTVDKWVTSKEQSVRESDFRPPTYDSLIPSQSQGAYTSVPVYYSQPALYPPMASVQQDTTPDHNPVNQVLIETEIPMSQAETARRNKKKKCCGASSGVMLVLCVIAGIVRIISTSAHQTPTPEIHINSLDSLRAKRMIEATQLYFDEKKMRKEVEEKLHSRLPRSVASVQPNYDHDFKALNKATSRFIEQLPQLKNSANRPPIYDVDHRFGHFLFKRNTRNKRLQGHVKRYTTE